MDMDKDRDFLLLIDGSSLLTTQYFGNLPREILFAKTTEEQEKYYHKIIQSSKGVYTNAILGFMRTFLKILSEQRPGYVAVAWDISRNTFRRELYADYKGNRGETPSPLKSQFILCQEMLKAAGVAQFMSEAYEADDFCGTLSRMFEDELPVRILTKDNDYLQLVSEKTNLWIMHSTQAKTDELYAKYHVAKSSEVPDRAFCLTPELVLSEFGVEPSSIADLKGLQGDSSDNIKGVPGVGPATAVALIHKYKTVEALYEALDGLDDKALKELAASWKDIGITRSPIKALLKDETELDGKRGAFLSKKLATIKRDIDLGDLSLEELKLSLNSLELQKYFDELEIRSLSADIGTQASPEKHFEFSFTDDIADAETFVDSIAARGEGTFTGVSLLADGSSVFGMAVSDCDRCMFIEAAGFINRAVLAGMLTRLDEAGCSVCSFDVKHAVKTLGIESLSSAFDTGVAGYLIDPLAGEYDPVSVSRRVLSAQTGDRRLLLGKLSVTEGYLTLHDELVGVCCEEADAALKCAKALSSSLEKTGMLTLFKEIEMPLVYVLASMEREGVLVRRDALKEYGQKLDVDIRRLEKEIYDYVGETFNINSPKQLGVILFEKLKLPYGKKTKTGYSTSADVLEKLKIEDPVIGKILEYRQLSKLKSTYADGLYDYIEADGRIRTTFNQTVTATGRLSSTEPNLQNIPIRMEMGRLFRAIFVPAEGYTFIDADYSQIELRILAALSGDEKLIGAYRDSLDVHASTAAAVFKVPLEEVTPQLRGRAKAVNFGIVYGISSFGLGNGLGISRKEAEQYIADYFETYPAVKAYLDRLVSEASADGYAVTYFGRRRPIPELSSTNYMQRQFGERIAMNSPIQGTAADIIKIAMIRVWKRLKNECPKSKLVLQVHDELLIETCEGDEDAVRRILTEEMTGAAQLKVALEIGLESGSNWLEAH